jgi:enolase-phosphatase E1
VSWPFLPAADRNSQAVLSIPLINRYVRALLLDIEGTTTPIDFVYGKLFSYARAHLSRFLRNCYVTKEGRAHLEAFHQQHQIDTAGALTPPPWQDGTPEAELESWIAYATWLMASDRKTTALKDLQGKIWEQGYKSGELHGEVFADVPPALKRLEEQKIGINIFSSGSVLAQKLLFANTCTGDLTPYISNYFDTTMGSKSGLQSYQRIQNHLGLEPGRILFISDVTPELDAAKSAGFQTLLCSRPGNHPQPPNNYQQLHSFDELFG